MRQSILPALSVIGRKLEPSFDNLGSQNKISVSCLVKEMPNLIFEAPTWTIRDSRYLSTRQGGLEYFTVVRLTTILLALAVSVGRYAFLSNVMKLIREKTMIDILCRFYLPVNQLRNVFSGLVNRYFKPLLNRCSLRIFLQRKVSKDVCLIRTGYLHRLVFSTH